MPPLELERSKKSALDELVDQDYVLPNHPQGIKPLIQRDVEGKKITFISFKADSKIEADYSLKDFRNSYPAITSKSITEITIAKTDIIFKKNISTDDLYFFPELGLGVAYHSLEDIEAFNKKNDVLEMYVERDIVSVYKGDEDVKIEIDINPSPNTPQNKGQIHNLWAHNQNRYRDAASDPLNPNFDNEKFDFIDIPDSKNPNIKPNELELIKPDVEQEERDQLNLNWGINRINARGTDFTGNGVQIGVLDTGIDQCHPDFKKTNIRPFSLVEDNSDIDRKGHGTHCASIAAGINGVAPRADLIIGKVLNDEGMGKELNLILGIFLCLMKGANVISFSIKLENGERGLSRDPFDRITKLAVSKYNCWIVCAAGNDSSRVGNHFPICSPADSRFALAISAIDDKNQFYTKCNRADEDLDQKMDFTAPGVDISAAYSKYARNNNTVLYKEMSGTSMAAPFIAGTIALIIEFLNKRYGNATFGDIKRTLRNISQKPANASWDELDCGKGIPNLLNLKN